MIPTQTDPAKLLALRALQNAGLTRAQIQGLLRISRATWYRWNAELKHLAAQAQAQART